MRKVTIIGGGGVRTPLLLYGLAQSQSATEIGTVTLYDIDGQRLELMARIGRELVRQMKATLEIRTASELGMAAESADFVLNSIRAGGISARARDERIAIDHGLAGQETTGPGGVAMALRTVPVILAQAKLVEHVAPQAWLINFTNPAGLITQALTKNTSLRVIGICDTPQELFHRIADAIGEPYDVMRFDYAGLNHLGWIRRVSVRGEDITAQVLADNNLLRKVYPASLFDAALIRTLQLIPTEYLFFYYSQRRARENQLRAGASRGEELQRLNAHLFDELSASDAAQAVTTYREYLKRRNATYMRLETQAESGFATANVTDDPFETVTGYHRIALEVIHGLISNNSREIVLNVPNRGSIEDLDADDIVEVPCDVDRTGAHPHGIGRLPESVRGLVESVKAYERTAIRASLEGSRALAQLAMLEYPIIGQWELAGEVLQSLVAGDPNGLGYLK